MSRHVPSDIDGRIDRMTITEDESCFILSNTARVATIKLLGGMSRNGYADMGLNDREILALERIYQIFQT